MFKQHGFRVRWWIASQPLQLHSHTTWPQHLKHAREKCLLEQLCRQIRLRCRQSNELCSGNKNHRALATIILVKMQHYKTRKEKKKASTHDGKHFYQGTLCRHHSDKCVTTCSYCLCVVLKLRNSCAILTEVLLWRQRANMNETQSVPPLGPVCWFCARPTDFYLVLQKLKEIPKEKKKVNKKVWDVCARSECNFGFWWQWIMVQLWMKQWLLLAMRTFLQGWQLH